MQGRTFFRIMIDNLLINNVFCKTLISLVKFCNEQQYFSQKKLKFSEKMPLTNISKNNSVYKTQFVFKSANNSGVKYF